MRAAQRPGVAGGKPYGSVTKTKVSADHCASKDVRRALCIHTRTYGTVVVAGPRHFRAVSPRVEKAPEHGSYFVVCNRLIIVTRVTYLVPNLTSSRTCLPTARAFVMLLCGNAGPVSYDFSGRYVLLFCRTRIISNNRTRALLAASKRINNVTINCPTPIPEGGAGGWCGVRCCDVFTACEICILFIIVVTVKDGGGGGVREHTAPVSRAPGTPGTIQYRKICSFVCVCRICNP